MVWCSVWFPVLCRPVTVTTGYLLSVHSIRWGVASSNAAQCSRSYTLADLATYAMRGSHPSPHLISLPIRLFLIPTLNFLFDQRGAPKARSTESRVEEMHFHILYCWKCVASIHGDRRSEYSGVRLSVLWSEIWWAEDNSLCTNRLSFGLGAVCRS